MTIFLPSIQQQLAQLVALPSVSSASAQWDMGNLEVIQLLANWLDELGFTTEIIPVPGKNNKANLIATLGSGPGGLVLAGHTDTVPYNESRWSQDPFKLTELDQRWYGLGATDMKGFFPVALAAIAPFVQHKAKLRQPLMILATADEESSMAGAHALVELGKPKARYAIIGEPTSLKPIRMHKGIMMEKVVVVGKSGHSSNPKLGTNAMEAMHQVITELLTYRQELQDKYRNPGFDVSVPTLNLGHIHGGDNPNRICGACELHFDLRFLPGMEAQALREQINQRVSRIAELSGTHIHYDSLMQPVPAFEQSADSEIVRITEKLVGYDSEAVAFATEAGFMQQLGMETLVFGPGCIDQAHQPDEYIELKQIQPAIDALTQLIKNLCL
jgi:acetylornithine deacetylase